MIKMLANLIGVPELLVQQCILPYTYLPQPRELLADIRSFVVDYRIVSNVYSFDFNDEILMTDLVNFCMVQYFTSQQYKLISNMPAIDMYLQTEYYSNNNVENRTRISRLIWGLLTIEERTRFITPTKKKNETKLS
jgi:hypothetical protein